MAADTTPLLRDTALRWAVHQSSSNSSRPVHVNDGITTHFNQATSPLPRPVSRFSLSSSISQSAALPQPITISSHPFTRPFILSLSSAAMSHAAAAHQRFSTTDCAFVLIDHQVGSDTRNTDMEAHTVLPAISTALKTHSVLHAFCSCVPCVSLCHVVLCCVVRLLG